MTQFNADRWIREDSFTQSLTDSKVPSAYKSAVKWLADEYGIDWDTEFQSLPKRPDPQGISRPKSRREYAETFMPGFSSAEERELFKRNFDKSYENYRKTKKKSDDPRHYSQIHARVLEGTGPDGEVIIYLEKFNPGSLRSESTLYIEDLVIDLRKLWEDQRRDKKNPPKYQSEEEWTEPHAEPWSDYNV